MQWVAGTSVIKDCIPVAHRYGGYQFGHWGGQVISKIEMIFVCTVVNLHYLWCLGCDCLSNIGWLELSVTNILSSVVFCLCYITDGKSYKTNAYEATIADNSGKNSQITQQKSAVMELF